MPSKEKINDGRLFQAMGETNADENIKFHFSLPQLIDFSRSRLMECKTFSDPYPHFVCQDIINPDFFRTLVSFFPGEEQMKAVPAKRTTNIYAHHYRRILCTTSSDVDVLDPRQQKIWKFFNAYVKNLAKNLINTLPSVSEKNRCSTYSDINPKFRIDLWSDRGGFQITPHTDSSNKLATFLIYCTDLDTLKAEGTSIFRPTDSEFKCWRGYQYPFDNFEEIKRIEYLPNLMFGFRKTDNSFHGKLPTKLTTSCRRTIAITLHK